MITLTQDNFEAATKASPLLLIDFWAAWCGPCRALAPQLEKLQQKYPDLVIGKVNVDEQPELSQKFGIASIPMMVLFREGQPVKQMVGVASASTIAETFEL